MYNTWESFLTPFIGQGIDRFKLKEANCNAGHGIEDSLHDFKGASQLIIYSVEYKRI